MDSKRALLMISFFGVGVGAALEVAAQGASTGKTALLAALMAGTLLAGFGLIAYQFAKWRLEYRIASLAILALIGFVAWSARLTGPVMITSDLRVTAMASQPEREMIRRGAIGLLLLFGVVFLALAGGKDRFSRGS